MKKFAILFLLTLSTLLFVSCNNEKADNDVLQNLESVVKQTTAEADDQFAYQKDLASWYKPETEYKYNPEGDNSSGIITVFRKGLNTYDLSDDKLYMETKRVIYESGIQEENMIAYMDIETGEKHYLCPDPLCTHSVGSSCLFVDVTYYFANPDNDNLLYTTKRIYDGGYYSYGVIVEINMEENSMREVFRCSDIYDDMFLESIDRDKLYFTYIKETERIKDEDGNVTTKNEEIPMYLDLSTFVAEERDFSKDKYDSFYKLYEGSDCIYWLDREKSCVLTTDTNRKNEKILLTYEKGYSIISAAYDSNTEELYLGIGSDDMIMASSEYDGIEQGDIWVVDMNNNIRKVDMPSEKITGFQLTNKYIYYTTYDPINYGMSPRGFDCIDEDGGKIYRVRRDDTKKTELVFDAQNELFFASFVVLGDYIYIDYGELVSGNGYAHFRWAGSTARIHMEEQTIKWLNFD